MPHAGATLLLRTAQTVGLTAGLSKVLAPWRKPLAIHAPAKIVLDVAVSLAMGGDCLADIAQLRACPEVFGLVASDPTVSRCIDALAADAPLRWRRSTLRARPPVRGHGHWPVSTPPITPRMLRRRW